MESCSNQKKCETNKNMFYLSFFKVATLCLDDSFAHFEILTTSFTWNAFPTVLKEFPHILSTCWLLFLHSVVKLKYILVCLALF